MDDPVGCASTLAEAVRPRRVAKFKEIVEKVRRGSQLRHGRHLGACGRSAVRHAEVIFPTPNAHLAYEICKGPRHFGGILTDEIGSAVDGG